MSQFVFKLEAVLEHRRFLERQKQRDVAAAQAQMAELQNQLRTVNERMQANTDDLRQNHLVGRLDMNYLAAHRRFESATRRQAMELVQKMAVVQRQLETAQKALAEAAKQRKILEKLREKQELRWRDEQSRREMAALDEVAMQMSYELSSRPSAVVSRP